MVKFGFFEVQSGFKSCTGYLYKGKEKKNVKKIHQISLENNFIIHKVREMQDSSNV
jgi:DNA-binding cell septation regulator SpoVG